MSVRPMESIDDVGLLRAEVATLRQLLEMLEATALEQTSRLQAAVRERTRIAEEMREQLEFTRAVTESMGEGVIAADRQQKVTFANRAAESLLARRGLSISIGIAMGERVLWNITTANRGATGPGRGVCLTAARRRRRGWRAADEAL